MQFNPLPIHCEEEGLPATVELPRQVASALCQEHCLSGLAFDGSVASVI
jgi:hypothetical protein